MKKHVPEGVASKEEQLVSLLQSLLGHECFGRLRGKWGRSVREVIENLLDQADSPNDFCDLWDQFTADVRVVGNMLAKYRRDGWKFAEEEMLTALIYGGKHLLPGEKIPSQKTIPVTILMLDPERTLRMIHWVMGGGDMDMYYVMEKGEYKNPLVQKLFESFPSLKEYVGQFREVDAALIAALYRDVMEHFPEYRDMQGRRLKLDADPERLSSFTNVLMKVWDEMQHVSVDSFGFVVFGKQDEVLRRFSRDKQKRIATWQLHLPRSLLTEAKKKQVSFADQFAQQSADRFPRLHLDIGFFPEAEHARWTELYPNMTSRGVAYGLGVMAAVGGMRKTQLTETAFPVTNPKKPEELRFWLEG